jgi:hypothetical protein
MDNKEMLRQYEDKEVQSVYVVCKKLLREHERNKEAKSFSLPKG